VLAASQRQQAVELQRAWDSCLGKMDVDFDAAIDQMETTNVLMRSLKTGPAMPPLGNHAGGASSPSAGQSGGGRAQSPAPAVNPFAAEAPSPAPAAKPSELFLAPPPAGASAAPAAGSPSTIPPAIPPAAAWLDEGEV